MTRISQLVPLLEISRAKYDRQRQSFERIMSAESNIRTKIARLEEMDQATRPSDDTPMRLIGADLQWQEWLARSRGALNMELARILAMKEHELQSVRQAFGKVTALEQLIEAEQKSARDTQAKAALDKAIAMSFRPRSQ